MGINSGFKGLMYNIVARKFIFIFNDWPSINYNMQILLKHKMSMFQRDELCVRV